MGQLKDQVSAEIIAAMKAKDKTKLNALRYLKKLFIENDTSKSPKPEDDILIAHAKKTKDSLEMFPEGSVQRDEIQEEIKVLEAYLPKQLSEQEVQAIIDDIKSKLENPNMGSLMKELSPLIKGKFDGKKASQMVQSALN